MRCLAHGGRLSEEHHRASRGQLPMPEVRQRGRGPASPCRRLADQRARQSRRSLREAESASGSACKSVVSSRRERVGRRSQVSQMAPEFAEGDNAPLISKQGQRFSSGYVVNRPPWVFCFVALVRSRIERGFGSFCVPPALALVNINVVHVNSDVRPKPFENPHPSYSDISTCAYCAAEPLRSLRHRKDLRGRSIKYRQEVRKSRVSISGRCSSRLRTSS